MSTTVEFAADRLQFLIRQVSRTFYQPRFVVALDQLARHPVLKDDDLAGRVGLQLKELTKIMAVLVNDKLVKIYRQNELKEGQQRIVGRAYYYVDYQHFCNVVKWRVAAVRRHIDDKMRNELENKGYICPQCNKSFDTLDVGNLSPTASFGFACDICSYELVDNENAESVKGSQDRMKRFNAQMGWIREGLKNTEDMVMPAFDIADWVKKHIIATNGKEDDGLKIAGSSGVNIPSLQIEMTTDKDDEQKRLERDRKADATRKQNQLPDWHLKSTVSGQLTALGVANTSSDNAAILAMAGTTQRDVKPTNPDKSEYYDRYYASLNAETAEEEPTAPAEVLDSLESLTPLETWDDDDDINFSIAPTPAPKRGREDDDGDPRLAKQPRTAYPHLQTRQPSESSGSVSSLGGGGMFSAPTRNVSFSGLSSFDDPPESVRSQGADEMVSVNGVMMPYSDVTEEHHDQMTPDEYIAYFKMFEARA